MSWLVAFLIVLGAAFAFVAALGVARLPDLYMRIHASTKAGAFGAALMLLGAALHFSTLHACVLAVIMVLFFYFTAPTAAQALGRAAYRRGTKLWEKTRVDQLKESGELSQEFKSGASDPEKLSNFEEGPGGNS